MARSTVCLLVFSVVLLSACNGGSAPSDGAAGASTINVEDLTRAVKVLASDEFEGRGPSSPGEVKTVEFLRGEFERVGLEPVAGSYTQDVPLVAITVVGKPEMTVVAGGETRRYAFGSEQVTWTKRVVEAVDVADSELVFVGYGIVAPEADWNDYAGLDMTGKTAVILVNDPGFATGDPELFNGNAMTYYGRWTYKYEEAARQGAAAAIIIHDTAPAAYPWAVVENSWTGPQFDLQRDAADTGRVGIEGWVQLEVAQQIFGAVGQDLAALSEAALRPGFQPVPLGARLSMSLKNTLERSDSKNVVGMLPGATRPDEYIIYMAHWDHLGIDPALEGDQIYNGALDNATGVAGLIELAEGFNALADRPARSVMFLAVTAEEQGLLGSAYYASSPLVPTAATVATINMDGLNTLGPMNDITITGYGNSELDDYLVEAAQGQNRTVVSDPEPEKGYYYRSDHFSLAKVGVPSLYPDAGTDHVEHGVEWTQQQRANYVANDYHKPSDEYRDDWDLQGAVDDLQLLFQVGHRIATSDDWPTWREGTEFKAIRDADRGARR